MDWIGSPEFHILMVIVWTGVAVGWTWRHVRGAGEWPRILLWVGMSAGWISYSLDEASALLSFPEVVVDVLAAFCLLAFVVFVGIWLRERRRDRSST